MDEEKKDQWDAEKGAAAGSTEAAPATAPAEEAAAAPAEAPAAETQA